jgi:hypothetical protein
MPLWGIGTHMYVYGSFTSCLIFPLGIP